MLVLVASVPITDGGKKTVKMPYIYYLVWFQDGQEQVRALLNSGSEVNAINPTFAQKPSFHIQKINVKAQKIDGSTFETFKIVIADFQVENKVARPRFFQKTFLVANTKFEVILGMLFLKLSNTDMSFGEKTLT